MSKPETGGIAADKLKSFIERIERLKAEMAELAADIKDLYAAAKAEGFVPKVLKQLIRERKLDPADRNEQFELLDLYRRALEEAPVAAETTINSTEERVAA